MHRNEKQWVSYYYNLKIHFFQLIFRIKEFVFRLNFKYFLTGPLVIGNDGLQFGVIIVVKAVLQSKEIIKDNKER